MCYTGLTNSKNLDKPVAKTKSMAPIKVAQIRIKERIMIVDSRIILREGQVTFKVNSIHSF